MIGAQGKLRFLLPPAMETYEARMWGFLRCSAKPSPKVTSPHLMLKPTTTDIEEMKLHEVENGSKFTERRKSTLEKTLFTSSNASYARSAD
ncbi:hypothetical protein AC579_7900 [Pseudocercospora musae]|uniref:Uncharacterized protein n=1 Tax=Pseudocercospora musae TaxID=113226 RepID=A0A139I6U2_9PEZI|nr:hypothetical protein AC579_7900 [Pseudocercospora musae]